MCEGYNKSLKILDKFFKFKYYKFASGKKIFSWTVPKECLVKRAYILTPDKKFICDYNENNLHLMNYSSNFNSKINLNSLKKY
jgi:aminopeptidase-like protein